MENVRYSFSARFISVGKEFKGLLEIDTQSLIFKTDIKNIIEKNLKWNDVQWKVGSEFATLLFIIKKEKKFIEISNQNGFDEKFYIDAKDENEITGALSTVKRICEEEARLEAERRQREEERLKAERRKREEAARLEAERRQREEAARLEAEKKFQENLSREFIQILKIYKAKRTEIERKQCEEMERLEAERKLQEKLRKDFVQILRIYVNESLNQEEYTSRLRKIEILEKSVRAIIEKVSIEKETTFQKENQLKEYIQNLECEIQNLEIDAHIKAERAILEKNKRKKIQEKSLVSLVGLGSSKTADNIRFYSEDCTNIDRSLELARQQKKHRDRYFREKENGINEDISKIKTQKADFEILYTKEIEVVDDRINEYWTNLEQYIKDLRVFDIIVSNLETLEKIAKKYLTYVEQEQTAIENLYVAKSAYLKTEISYLRRISDLEAKSTYYESRLSKKIELYVQEQEEAARLEAERRKREEAARLEAERRQREEEVRLEAERRKREELARLVTERKQFENELSATKQNANVFSALAFRMANKTEYSYGYEILGRQVLEYFNNMYMEGDIAEYIDDNMSDYDALVLEMEYYGISKRLCCAFENVISDLYEGTDSYNKIISFVEVLCMELSGTTELVSSTSSSSGKSYEWGIDFDKEIMDARREQKELRRQKYEKDYKKVLDYICAEHIPVTKAQIESALPDVNKNTLRDVLVNENRVLNFYRTYIWYDNLNITDQDVEVVNRYVKMIVSNNDTHHITELYEILNYHYSDFLKRNMIDTPHRLFSVVQVMSKSLISSERPYIARSGVEILNAKERLVRFVYGKNNVSIKELLEYANSNYMFIGNILQALNELNKTHVFKNKITLVSIHEYQLSHSLTRQIENVFLEEVEESRALAIGELTKSKYLPEISLEWNEWLVYSLLLKWGNELKVTTTGNHFRDSIPVVYVGEVPDEEELEKIANRAKGKTLGSAIDISDVDEVFEDILDDILEDLEF